MFRQHYQKLCLNAKTYLSYIDQLLKAWLKGLKFEKALLLFKINNISTLKTLNHFNLCKNTCCQFRTFFIRMKNISSFYSTKLICSSKDVREISIFLLTFVSQAKSLNLHLQLIFHAYFFSLYEKKAENSFNMLSLSHKHIFLELKI